MKKVLAAALVCLFMLTMMAACGSGDDTQSQDSSSPPENTSAANFPAETPPSTVIPSTNPPAANTPASNSPAETSPASPPPANNFNSNQLISFYTREDGSGTRDAFISITGVGDEMSVEAITVDSTNLILTGVEANEYSIGYVSVGSLNDNVKALIINGVYPSNETIIDGTYELQRALLVCVNEEKAGLELVQDLIAFMLSVEGQSIASSSWTPTVDSPVVYVPSGLSGTLTVGGSTSVEPLMQRLRDAYLAHNPGIEIEISGGGSGTGINQATEGIIDIGMSSRDLREGELADLTPYNIALDGVAVVVNPANPLSALTIEQVRSIYVGEIDTWAELN